MSSRKTPVRAAVWARWLKIESSATDLRGEEIPPGEVGFMPDTCLPLLDWELAEGDPLEVEIHGSIYRYGKPKKRKAADDVEG